MKILLRNIAAFMAGLVIGSAVNMGLIMISGNIIPPPSGADVTTMEGLVATMHLFEPKHFLFPFLAHALGTFFGAMLASLVAATHRAKFALAIGAMFLVGGIINVIQLPSPLWFSALDLVVAYIPMAWMGGRLAEKIRPVSLVRLS